MESYFLESLESVRLIQEFRGPKLDFSFRLLTFLGDIKFYIVLLPFLVWCIDYWFGCRVAISVMVSAYISVLLKEQFELPRPGDLDPDIAVIVVKGYGLPSGHALLAVVVWGTIALRTNRLWTWVVCVATISLISLSRVYLGVHFPIDVYAGLVIGVVLLLAIHYAYPVCERWIVRLRVGSQLLLSLVIPATLSMFFHMLASNVKMASLTMGILAGVTMGAALKLRYFQSLEAKSLWRRGGFFLFGIGIVFALYYLPKEIRLLDTFLYHSVGAFIHSSLIGLWVSLGAPALFILVHNVLGARAGYSMSDRKVNVPTGGVPPL